MGYRGDYNPGTVLYFNFTSLDTSVSPAVPFTLVGGTVKVIKDDSASLSTAGITLTTDLNGIVGLNNVKIDTGANGTVYSAGSHFQAVITAGTVNGVTVAGYVLDSFSLQAGMAATLATLATNMTTVLARLGSITGTGVNTVLGFFKALLSKTASVPSDIGGTFIPATDSTEALADNVSGGSLTQADIRDALGLAIPNLDTQLVSLQADTDNIQVVLSGLSTLDADGIRDALGLAIANLDAQLVSLQADTDAIQITLTGISTLDAAGIRSAIGMGIANLDIQLHSLNDYTDPVGVLDVKSTVGKGVRFLVNRFLNERTQSTASQELKNDAGATIATSPVSNVGGVQTIGQAV